MDEQKNVNRNVNQKNEVKNDFEMETFCNPFRLQKIFKSGCYFHNIKIFFKLFAHFSSNNI
jgi:hypothetical protein